MRFPGLTLAVCVSVLGLCVPPALADTSSSSFSPSLVAQAHRLYAPARRFERSLTTRQKRLIHMAPSRVGKKIDACTKPYSKQLTSQQTKSERRLYTLWNEAGTLQTYQAIVKPAAQKLALLAATWTNMKLRNRALREFARGIAGELHLTLDAAPFNTCLFIRKMARHHFSASWAARSSYGQEAASWSKQIGREGERPAAFWNLVYPNPLSTESTGLFTKHQLDVLGNIPGEVS